jgi:hypothetical protein
LLCKLLIPKKWDRLQAIDFWPSVVDRHPCSWGKAVGRPPRRLTDSGKRMLGGRRGATVPREWAGRGRANRDFSRVNLDVDPSA